jgi:uncharacterized protein
LVAGDIDERVMHDAKLYDEVYDSKLTLTIFPTGKCNFCCPYCFEASKPFSREAMTMDAQNAVLKFVQRNIPNHKALHVNWFGGEPLLEPEIIERLSNQFIQICNTRFLPYSADIITNGFFLDADMFDMLYKLKVYNYMITIDGFKEQHDQLRFAPNLDGEDFIIDGLYACTVDKDMRNLFMVIYVGSSVDICVRGMRATMTEIALKKQYDILSLWYMGERKLCLRELL